MSTLVLSEMRLADVLAQVPGLHKRFVYYLEAQGYLHPRKVQKARIARRDYNPEDVRLLRSVWRYYSRGVSVQRAVELATHQNPTEVYALCPVIAGRQREALGMLQRFDQVGEAAVLYGGELAHLLVKVLAAEDADVYAVLDRLFERGIVTGAPRILRASSDAPDGTERPAAVVFDQKGIGRDMLAWVLIKLPTKQIGGLVDRLREIPGIVEAAAIYGETDVIAKVMVTDQRALDEIIMERIQGIPNVESTRTFIAVGDMHWQRM